MERRLAAVMAADVVGYAGLMEHDEAGTLAGLKALRQTVIEPAIAEHHGRVVKLMGDGVLVEFASVIDAVECAIAIQNAHAPADGLPLRIGINLGDIMVDGDDIYGDGVNVAARLEAMAPAGGICISATVHHSIANRVDADFADAGEHAVKNIERPIRVFRWPADAGMPLAPGQQPPLPDKPSIVVLPFDNLAAEPGQDYFVDGMVEAVTAALANIRSFFVIARNTAFTYKGKHTDVRDIGRQLGVGYALEGSVQRAGDRVRITAQLVETANGAHLWSRHFDGTLDDIFELQDDITAQVAGALLPSIQLAEIERTRRKRPQDFGAYDFTMQALPHCWSLEKDEASIALDHLAEALRIDPEYPLALALAAWCHAQRSVYNWTDTIVETKAEAVRLAEQAAHLSNDDPLILAILGTAHTIVHNLGTARILLERAVAIDPNAAWAWSRLGWLDTYADNLQPALENFAKAQRLSPLDPLMFNNYMGIGSAYQGAEQYDKAVEYYQRGLRERPQAAWVYRHLAAALVGAGRMDEAHAAYAKMIAAYPDLTAEKVRQALAFLPGYMDRMIGQLKTLGLPDA